jgi:short-subunit dehydrogenase
MLLTLGSLFLCMYLFPSFLIGLTCKFLMLVYILSSLGATIFGPSTMNLSSKAKNKSSIFQPKALYTGYAVVTGASTGIGREIAKNLARQGWNLILVSTAESVKLLEDLSKEIQFKNSRVILTSLAIDLASMTGPDELIERVKKLGLEEKIEIFVNNAGVGSTSYFTETNWEELDNLIHLDVRATAKLSHYFLGKFVENGRGRLLNVGSTVGYVAGPRAATYCAAKSFINSLTTSLQYECDKLLWVKRKNDPAAPIDVNITLAAFGPIPDTNFGERSHSGDMVFFKVKPNLISARRAGFEAVNGLLLNQPTVIPGFANRMLVAMFQVLPDHVRNLMNDYCWGETRDLQEYFNANLTRVQPIIDNSKALYSHAVHYTNVGLEQAKSSQYGQKFLNSSQFSAVKSKLSAVNSEELRSKLRAVRLPTVKLPEVIEKSKLYQKYVGRGEGEDYASETEEEKQLEKEEISVPPASVAAEPSLSSFTKPFFFETEYITGPKLSSAEIPSDFGSKEGLSAGGSVFDAARDNKLNFHPSLVAQKTVDTLEMPQKTLESVPSFEGINSKEAHQA